MFKIKLLKLIKYICPLSRHSCLLRRSGYEGRAKSDGGSNCLEIMEKEKLKQKVHSYWNKASCGTEFIKQKKFSKNACKGLDKA